MRKLLNSELERLNIEEFKKTEKTSLIVILDDIRSLNNIGYVFRTSDAFLVQEIFLCGITAQPPHREIHKTALGSTESVKWSYFDKIEDAIGKAKELNFNVVEKHFTPEEVKGADGAFFTGTAAEVAGIESLDGVKFTLNWEDTMGNELSRMYKYRASSREYQNFDLV